MLSRRLGEDREVTNLENQQVGGQNTYSKFNGIKENSLGTSPLTRQFEGYKFGKVALKQVLEYCFIIQKPRKYGTFVDDCLAWNDGDTSISPMSFNVEGSRVGLREKQQFTGAKNGTVNAYGEYFFEKSTVPLPQGRYPAHCFLQEQTRFNLNEPFDSLQNRFAFEYYSIDTDLYSEKGLLAIMQEINSVKSTKEMLDGQSGVSKSSGGNGSKFKGAIWGTAENIIKNDKNGLGLGDTAGCSKALHNCTFSAADYDILNYFPKVSQKERALGTENLAIKHYNTLEGGDFEGKNSKGQTTTTNSHPTLKSIDLVAKLSKLFLQPYEMQVLVPFSGVCSEVLGLVKAGFNPDNITGIEISKEYVEIGLARLNYWLPKFNVQTVVKTETKEVKITKPQGTLF